MRMKDLMAKAVERKASDLHITVGVPPIVRINGSLVPLEKLVLEAEDTESFFNSISSEEQQERFERLGELDFSYALKGFSRFRVNAFRQRGSIAIVVRVVPEKSPTLEELGHPEILKTLARLPRGLVLVTRPTGSGKSTTLAAMVNLINAERACHIVTLEDPIEYLHKHNKSIINQREIHADTRSFANAREFDTCLSKKCP